MGEENPPPVMHGSGHKSTQKGKTMKVILKLSEELCREGIPHYIVSTGDGAQIRFPWCGGDVLHGRWSHGEKDGHVETWSFPWDGDDVTELSVTEVFESIKGLFVNR